MWQLNSDSRTVRWHATDTATGTEVGVVTGIGLSDERGGCVPITCCCQVDCSGNQSVCIHRAGSTISQSFVYAFLRLDRCLVSRLLSNEPAKTSLVVPNHSGCRFMSEQAGRSVFSALSLQWTSVQYTTLKPYGASRRGPAPAAEKFRGTRIVLSTGIRV